MQGGEGGNGQQRTELQIKNRFKALLKKEDAAMDVKANVEKLINRIMQRDSSKSRISKGEISEDEEDNVDSDAESIEEEF